MKDPRETWLGVEDLPDRDREIIDVEHQQEQYLLETIGHRLYEFLCEEEDRHGQDREPV